MKQIIINETANCPENEKLKSWIRMKNSQPSRICQHKINGYGHEFIPHIFI